MRIAVFLFLVFLLGCTEPINLQESLNQEQAPRVPESTRLTYSAQSLTTSVTAPFSAALLIYPDFQTGICSSVANTAELTLEGTYDERRTLSIEAVGITTQSSVLSDGSFTLRFCAAAGSTSISVVATSESGKKSDPINFSINLTPALGTIGFGLAKYPNPGFRVESLASSPTSLTSSTWKAEALAMATSQASQLTTTIGSTTWNLSVGLVPVLKEVQP